MKRLKVTFVTLDKQGNIKHKNVEYHSDMGDVKLRALALNWIVFHVEEV